MRKNSGFLMCKRRVPWRASPSERAWSFASRLAPVAAVAPHQAARYGPAALCYRNCYAIIQFTELNEVCALRPLWARLAASYNPFWPGGPEHHLRLLESILVRGLVRETGGWDDLSSHCT